jgi:hypothetical protein
MMHREVLRIISCFLLALPSPALAAASVSPLPIVPTPHFYEPLNRSVQLPHGSKITIVPGPRRIAGNDKLKLSADYLRHNLQREDSSLQIDFTTAGKGAGARVYLWDYSADPRPRVGLSVVDRQILTDSDYYRQSYVIRTPDTNTIWVIGSSDQGVLFGTMSLLQLVKKASEGLEIAGAYIRDYPDFRYRAAANWLLNVEINRWALDWGHGGDEYKIVCERELDEALRFKINMVVFDGFGWGLKQRFPGYAELMRSLNLYARDRGIRLLYGGYGASYGIAYQSGPLYEAGAYMGHIFKNRKSYPNGPVYECMGFPSARNSIDTRTLGSCRGNEELNRLKGEELQKFVQAVEPGALYIHHEDFGGYRGTQSAWLQRCSLCRRRWSNDSLKAADGGAGGLANGYSALIRAVDSVNNADGYKASRNCLIILVSPVYDVNSLSPTDWSNVLELWKNIGRQLPREHNVLVCFREVFPRPQGGRTWVEAFNATMKTAGLNIGAYVFAAGGADNYITDYPLTGTPALGGIFRGAAGIFNASGNFYEEPMEVINAQYDWNLRPASPSRDPRTYHQAVKLWRRFAFGKNQPPELFDADSIYNRACDLLYGVKAASMMAKYYELSQWVPDTLSEAAEVRDDPANAKSDYLPMMWDRVYAMPEHWRDLAVDSNTWSVGIGDREYGAQVARLHITIQELHRRLARHWSILAALNTQGAREVELALDSDPRQGSVTGFRFLETSFRVDQPLLEALADFHRGMVLYVSLPSDKDLATGYFQKALAEAQKSHDLALQAFPNPVDPVGGEVGAIRNYSEGLIQSIKENLQ